MTTGDSLASLGTLRTPPVVDRSPSLPPVLVQHGPPRNPQVALDDDFAAIEEAELNHRATASRGRSSLPCVLGRRGGDDGRSFSLPVRAGGRDLPRELVRLLLRDLGGGGDVVVVRHGAPAVRGLFGLPPGREFGREGGGGGPAIPLLPPPTRGGGTPASRGFRLSPRMEPRRALGEEKGIVKKH
ncbi:hypothetical protein ACHAW5_008008 [Stephanodiscus triporus]|uniref:Uncharacterized protein n=1 Tax=Stephanodiscus triporus TaxID=2934178 RepID=A0ABD3P7H5_9STRA